MWKKEGALGPTRRCVYAQTSSPPPRCVAAHLQPSRICADCWKSPNSHSISSLNTFQVLSTHTHTLLLFDNSATHQPLLYLQKCSSVFSPVLAPTCALQLVKNTWLGKTVSFPRLEGAGKHIPSDLWETSNYGALVWDAPYITPRLIAPNYRKKRKFGTLFPKKDLDCM